MNRLVIKIMTMYFIIWLLAVMFFWLFKNTIDVQGYSLLVFYLIIPIITFVTSLLIGKNTEKWLSYIMPLLFGIMYMLLEYMTFSLANNIKFHKINVPEFSMTLIGTIISLIGLLIGKEMNKKRNL